MSRFRLAAFLTLVVATVAAFFIAQHLKVSTPLISGMPQPFPAVIDPVDGPTCYDRARRQEVDTRVTEVSFYLLNHSDKVDVYVVNRAGKRVATLATGQFMKAALFPHEVATRFTWNGREQDGAIAPNGTYYIRVDLTGERRTITISNDSGPEPVTVTTTAPSSCP